MQSKTLHFNFKRKKEQPTKCVVCKLKKRGLLLHSPLYRWWAHQDLNLGPKDSGLCDFRHSLDFAFTILIAQFRWVPSSLYTFRSAFTLRLRSALPYVLPHLGFTDFDTIPYTVSTCKAHLKNMSPLL